MSCAVEKVISPTTGQSGWVIVDEESMRPVAEASEWVLFMQGRRKVTSNNPRIRSSGLLVLELDCRSRTGLARDSCR